MARILLAEDDDNLRPFLARSLENAGHEVLAFSDGEDALPALNVGEVDILISDLVMPGMNGIELARYARKQEPDLPVIFITGFSAVAMEALDAVDGVSKVLSKPFHLNSLVDAVQNALEDRAIS
ncbi:MAG: response regulator [Sneathiella sp.]|uniref:response regulator n=1 Tax=Sneathiella sp. TaxID=1964365 RepID=UPI000C511A3F|nr:response regulator [Sneathiella sp.]MAZ02685.1 response regulator [Sneathiella sp.]|tara:strand:- start:1216 stop:1587 length:372 start_codon:yes stop_codon:yes gene_type:complete